jgi:hypothetical protein
VGQIRVAKSLAACKSARCSEIGQTLYGAVVSCSDEKKLKEEDSATASEITSMEEARVAAAKKGAARAQFWSELLRPIHSSYLRVFIHDSHPASSQGLDLRLMLISQPCAFSRPV